MVIMIINVSTIETKHNNFGVELHDHLAITYFNVVIRVNVKPTS